VTISAGPHVGILVFDDADELDVVGPFGVFADWAARSALQPTVTTFSHDGAGVRLAHGLRLVPAAATADLGALHVLVHPGGMGMDALLANPAHLEWLRSVRAGTSVIAGIGTGALALAAAGMLAWRPAVTRPGSYDALLAADPSVVVESGAPFVDDGDVVTAAGVTGGIDLALHVVARLETPAAARGVREHIAHDSASDLDDGL
jgi:transcriptional regulator GlxA family with amidase domain